MKSTKKKEAAPRGKVILLVRRAELSASVSEGTYHQGREFLQQNGFLSVGPAKDLDDKEKPGHVAAFAPWLPQNFIVVEYQEDRLRQLYMDFKMFLVTPRCKKLIENGKIQIQPIQRDEGKKEELWLKGYREENWEVEAETVPEAMATHLARFAEGNANVQHIEAVDLDAFELPEEQKQEKEEVAELSEDARQLQEDLAPVSMKDLAVAPETVKRFSVAPGRSGIYGAKFTFVKPVPIVPGSLATKSMAWAQSLCAYNPHVAKFVQTHCNGVCTVMALSDAVWKLSEKERKKAAYIADLLALTDAVVYQLLHMQDLHKDLQPLLEISEGELSFAVAVILCKVDVPLQPKVWNEIKSCGKHVLGARKIQKHIFEIEKALKAAVQAGQIQVSPETQQSSQ
jgi:hypothetical protein